MNGILTRSEGSEGCAYTKSAMDTGRRVEVRSEKWLFGAGIALILGTQFVCSYGITMLRKLELAWSHIHHTVKDRVLQNYVCVLLTFLIKIFLPF